MMRDFMKSLLMRFHWIQDSLLFRALDLWSKGCEFKSRQERWKKFLLQSQLFVLTLIWCPFHSVSRQWHVKDPSYSDKSADGRLQLNTHTSRTNKVGVGWLCRCPGIVREPIWKWAHTQLVGGYSVTVISDHWATVDWSWPKEWN